MLIQEIAANAMDLAGGELINARGVDRFSATLHTLNIIDTMMLELSQSRKASRSLKVNFAIAANTNTGTIVVTSLNLDTKLVRWRRQVTDRWELLDVVEDVEDLTRAENEGRQAILFRGALSPITYDLSWTPVEAINAELWGKQLMTEPGNLNEAPPFPPEFSLLCAYRVVWLLLDELLLIDPKYERFAVSRKASLADDKRRCEFIWLSHRTAIPDQDTKTQGREYNVLEDEVYGLTDDVESFTERRG